MLTQSSHITDDVVSDSSSDDEEYMQHVPIEKVRFVKSYKRIKSQLKAIKKKKKMILIQEKVIKEEKMLLKNLLFNPSETPSEVDVKKINESEISSAISKVETSDYSNETDIQIQIQQEQHLSRVASLENIVTEISDKSNILSAKCNPPENKDIECCESIKEIKASGIEPDKNADEQDKIKSNWKIFRHNGVNKLNSKKKGSVSYKMIDLENGYYINITKELALREKYFLVIKKILRSMKPIMSEFDDFISLDLFTYVVRVNLMGQISDLLVGKKKLKCFEIMELFRQKYPEEMYEYYIISILVGIWRGDFNDPADPDDPYNDLVRNRDPEKLVSFEDISSGKGIWQITTTPPQMCEKDKNSTNSENDAESKDLNDMDSSFEIVDQDNTELSEDTPMWNEFLNQDESLTEDQSLTESSDGEDQSASHSDNPESMECDLTPNLEETQNK